MKYGAIYILIVGILHVLIGLIGLMGWWDAVFAMVDILAYILFAIGGLAIIAGILMLLRKKSGCPPGCIPAPK